MARKRDFVINRFDGGITDDIRTSDLSKCAHVSHFDIYCDPHKLIPLPGYIADQDTVSGGADDLQNYNIRAFVYGGDVLWAVGTKSNGTGSKLWQKATPTTASWTASANGEGTDDLADNTFLYYDDQSYLYFVTHATNTYLSQHQTLVATTDKHATIQTGLSTMQHVIEYAQDDNYYGNPGQDDIFKIAGATVTDPAKDTAIYVSDIQSGNEQIGIAGYRFYPYRAQLIFWDSGSTLIDRKVELGEGREVVLGYPGGVWVAVVNATAWNRTGSSFDEAMNGRHELIVKYISGNQAIPLVTLMGKVSTNAEFRPTRGKYKDAMLFYAKLPQDATPTTYKQGIWAVGRCKEDSPLAVSLLLDTTDLGSLEGYYQFSDHHFFAHGGDGSVSRLDNFRTGTYDVDAEYHTLMFGSDTPYIKELNGVTVLTEDLPASASVEVFYRFDEDDSWTTMGTSSTTGKEEHNFTRVSGVPIGKFREVQFKVVVSGKVIIKNIVVSILESDDLSFNL